MNPRQRALEVFGRLLDLPENQREPDLARLRAQDPPLHQMVAELLDADRAAGDFLSVPAGVRAAPLVTDSEDARWAGKRIGAYRVERLLGRGGMGQVFLAQRADGAFEQTVAIKLLPAGRGDEWHRRFVAERQILAGLEHPNIARLLDGGVTEDGQPYFAMEFVPGVAITDHCDGAALSLAQRIELFLAVCDAVSHAHRNLIVHRDLKPSNILAADGQVRLVDFGIAKVLDAEPGAPATLTGHRMLTPEYAAPEQILGQAVTTGTDVYALGLLLYELLSGRRAQSVETTNPADAERIVCRSDPTPLSQAVRGSGSRTAALRGLTEARLERVLAGDLENIVAKALRKDPGNRYDSVAALAADLRRYRDGRPILARPVSRLTRTWKFIRRHPVGVGTGLAIVILAGALAVNYSVSNLRIRAALADLEVEAGKSAATVAFLRDLFQYASTTDAARMDLTAREILDQGATRIREELSDQPDVRAVLLSEIGTIYHFLDLNDRARSMLGEALQLQRDTLGPVHPHTALTLHRLALVSDHLGEYEAAETYVREALAMRRELFGDQHPDTAESMDFTASLTGFAGNYAEAEPLARTAVATFRRTVGMGDERAITALSNLAWLLYRQQRYDEAAPVYLEAIEWSRKVLGDDSSETLLTLDNYAVMLRRQGRLEDAEAIQREVLQARIRVLGEGHTHVGYSHNNLARLLHQQGSHDEAAVHYRHALAVFKSMDGGEQNLAHASSNLARLEVERGQFDAAAELYVQAIDLWRQVLPASRPRFADSLAGYGQFLIDRRDFAAAEAALREALDHYAQMDPAPGKTATAQLLLGLALTEQDKRNEAAPLIEASYPALLEELGAEHDLTKKAAAVRPPPKHPSPGS